MNRFRYTLLTTVAALLIAQALLFTSPGRTLAQNITSVLVTNTAANPILIRDVDNGRQPFQGHAFADLAHAEAVADIVTIPAGKRLVVESVSAIMYLPTGQTPPWVFLANLDSSNLGLSHHVLTLTRQGSYGSGAATKTTFAGTFALRMYAASGTRLAFDALSSGTGGLCEVFVTGYYIDVP